MGLNLEYINGQTPIDDEEKEGLLIPTISTLQELDEFEQQNIEEAIQWLLTRKLKPSQIFTEKFLMDLHKRMYGHVWRWAGNYRHSQKNIGVNYYEIPAHVKMLLDDALLWHQNTVFPPDELAIRFKHRLVSIHCFPNGNGRHSRLIADVIVEKVYGLDVFPWGSENLSKSSDQRDRYIKAVQLADQENFGPLMEFARS